MAEPLYAPITSDVPQSGFSRLQIELDTLEQAIDQLLDRCRPLLTPERELSAELCERAPESGLGSAAHRVARLRSRIDDIATRLDV